MPGETAVSKPVRILAVVALYGQTVAESAGITSLRTAVIEAQAAVDCVTLAYDNTPSGEAHPDRSPFTDDLQYQRAAGNRGLYGAYDAALTMALQNNREWLLTLDQDTALPPDYFAKMRAGLLAAQRDERIAAIVPHLIEGNRRLSPAYAGIGRARPLPRGFYGVPAGEVRAFNSAALLRVNGLRDVGGFDPCFWLDYLDCWLHHQLYMRAWKVYVIGDLEITHQLSLLDYGERVSPERYASFLAAEGAYVDLYCSGWERALYAAQLAVRAGNQRRRGEDREIQLQTRRTLAERLRSRRADRLRRWRESCQGSSSP